MSGHQGLDLRQPVEPGHQLPAFLPVEQALVQFLADGHRQTGDFAVARVEAGGQAGVGRGEGRDGPGRVGLLFTNYHVIFSYHVSNLSPGRNEVKRYLHVFV